ncbi:MAG: helix-turn-helix domain-containing protein [Alistipes sp.]|nr:helix-turn-helix domain-containing protein [Alistipes sp.]
MNKFELGDNIRKRRKYIGKNQEEIANRISVSKSQISKWENENSYPYLSDFEKLSVAMNIHPADLVTGKIEEDLIENKEKKEKSRALAIGLLTVTIIILLVSAFVLVFRLKRIEEKFSYRYDSNLLYDKTIDNDMHEVRQVIKSKNDDVWIDIITYQKSGIILDYILNEVVFTGYQTENEHMFKLNDDGTCLEVYISYIDEAESKMSLVEVKPLK